MESSRNIKKLKARQNRKKRSSVVMILKGSRERVRSLQTTFINAAGSTSHSRFPDSHVLVIRSDVDNNNSDMAWRIIKDDPFFLLTISIICLSRDIFGTTFPEMDRHLSMRVVLWPMVHQLFELTYLLMTYYVMLLYIRGLLNKDRKEKLVLSRRVVVMYFFGFVSAIYLCICSTVQYANFHQHEDDDQFRKAIVLSLFSLCLIECRQLCYSGANELQYFPHIIREGISDKWIYLVIQITLAIFSTTYAQILSSPTYAVLFMVVSVLFVSYTVLELVVKGRKERVKLRRRGMLWWFYHPDPDCRPFGTFTEIYGLISAFYQCMFSIVQSACFILHVENPLRLCLLPTIFLVCLASSTTNGSHRKKVISKEHMFLLINIGLEISAAIFEQLSSSRNPHYALYSMLLAVGAVVISVWEFADRGKKEKVRWTRQGKLWWFYHPPPQCTPFGTLSDIYGLIGGVAQSIFSTIQYVCYIRHVENPFQFCLLPLIFLFCVAHSKRTEKAKTH